MTIYKVIPQDKKQEKKVAEKEALAVPLTENEGGEETTVHVANRRQRSKLMLNLFLVIIALLVLATGITGGYYIYKNHLSKEIRRGTCHFMVQRPTESIEMPHALPVQGDDEKVTTGLKKIDDGGLTRRPHKHHGKHRGHHKQRQTFTEIEMEEEIEVIDGMVEKIKMPKMDDIMDSLILHDFIRNYSAIVNYLDNVCYVMKLNRKEVAPPKNLIDLIYKINTGYYLPRAEVLIRRFRVLTPALKDVRFLGPYISRHCFGHPTFRLERMTGIRYGNHRLTKRSTVKTFGEFTGKEFVEYKIQQ